MVIIYALSFLSIGLWIALAALKRRLLPKEFLYIGALAASLTLYYAIFYLYLVRPSLAGTVVKLVFVLSFAVFIKLCVDVKKSKQLFKLVKNFFIIPLSVTAVIMFAYSTVFFSCVSRAPALAGYQELDNRTFCHTSNLPFDNSLAFIFGNNILDNQDKKLAIDWNMVDRPPLQIAATLPILDLGPDSQFVKYYSYYVFSIFLQLAWVAAFWGIFQTLKMTRRFQIMAFTALAATGFFYVNSVFVWPKLLAAGLVVTGIFVLLGKDKPSKYKYLPFSALLISLGMLSHSAVLFTIIPFALYYAYKIIRLRKINLKYVAAALAIGLVLLAPWFAYKDSVAKVDRLAKWHFAGIISAEDKRGTVEAITDEYKKLDFNEWAGDKWTNVKTLVTGNYTPLPNCSLGPQGLIDKCLFLDWRGITFFSTFFAFEFLSLGWLGVLYQFIRGKIDTLDKELTLLILGSVVFWVLIMFIPGGSIVHAGSYATMMLMFLLVIKKLSELPAPITGTIAVLQVALFYLAWVTPYFRLV